MRLYFPFFKFYSPIISTHGSHDGSLSYGQFAITISIASSSLSASTYLYKQLQLIHYISYKTSSRNQNFILVLANSLISYDSKHLLYLQYLDNKQTPYLDYHNLLLYQKLLLCISLHLSYL